MPETDHSLGEDAAATAPQATPRGDEAVLVARDLSVARDGKALVAVPALELRPAETHVILGPNGAGKTTLLAALNGLVPCAGRLWFLSREVRTAADRLRLRRQTAAVFQEPFLLATSVHGNVEQGLRLRGCDREETRVRATAALELLAIAHLAGRRRDGLSGGEAQRVSVARALAVDHGVLFLDEPLASLDPPTRRSLTSDLKEIFAARATAVAWVTHDKEEAVAAGDEVTFLSGGHVAQSGSAASVFERPATQEIADYLGIDAWLEGTVTNDDVVTHFELPNGARIACGEAPLGPAVACIHPEDVALFTSPPAPGSTSLRNVVTGTVKSVRSAGRLRYVTVSCEGFDLAALGTQAACDELHIGPGSPVYAAFKATAVEIIARPHRLD
jgi:tungstate transport system ATP-binding protein